MNPDGPERERRDRILFLFFLPVAILVMLLVGQLALALAPQWSVSASMASNLDPDALTTDSPQAARVEPLLPAILTPPAWQGTFLTPEARGTATPTAGVWLETSTPTPHHRASATEPPSPTKTATATATASPTRSQTATPSATLTPTPTLSATPTRKPTHTPSATPSSTPSHTPGSTATKTPAAKLTSTPTATVTKSNSPTVTPSTTPSQTSTATPTHTQTPTGTATSTPPNTPTATPTWTLSPSATDTPTATSLTPMNLNYICAGAANLHWIIINPNSYPINYTWSGDIYSGNGTADQGLNQLTTPVGSGPYSVTITYPGGSDTDSPTSATCPSWP